MPSSWPLPLRNASYTSWAVASAGEERAAAALRGAREALEGGLTPDAVLSDAEQALSALGELTGRTLREDLTARIFERFCVGK